MDRGDESNAHDCVNKDVKPEETFVCADLVDGWAYEAVGRFGVILVGSLLEFLALVAPDTLAAYPLPSKACPPTKTKLP
jgi:hypothetical protein